MGIWIWGDGCPTEWLRNPAPLVWRRRYAGTTDQVPAARQFVTTLLEGTSVEDEAAFVVTELATNALIHTLSGNADGWFGVEVVMADLVTIAVTDLGGTGYPTIRPDCPGDDPREHGRGLHTIAKLAAALGVHGSRQNGHRVWVDLDLNERPGPRFDLAAVLVL